MLCFATAWTQEHRNAAALPPSHYWSGQLTSTTVKNIKKKKYEVSKITGVILSDLFANSKHLFLKQPAIS